MPYPSPKSIVKPAMMSDEPACCKGSRTRYKEADGNDSFFTLHLGKDRKQSKVSIDRAMVLGQVLGDDF
jgi:hypothetical protein